MSVYVQTAPSVVERLAALRARIERRARDCDRDPSSVRLVAVSKTFSADEVWPTIAEGGQILFGENRVQEAKAKWPILRERAAALGKIVELHLIGPLQSNKAREAVELFDAIETLDREKNSSLRSPDAMAKTVKPQAAALHSGQYPARSRKGGRRAAAGGRVHRALVREKYRLSIDGLMCIPPVDEQASPHFALLAQIAARNGVKELSMGMSADFELAIQLGATYVRVGSAIFGGRA